MECRDLVRSVAEPKVYLPSYSGRVSQRVVSDMFQSEDAISVSLPATEDFIVGVTMSLTLNRTGFRL